MSTPSYGPGIEIKGRITPEYAQILTPEAVAFAVKLQRPSGRAAASCWASARHGRPTSNGKPVEVRKVLSGPNLARFEIYRELEVPASLSPDRKTRSAEIVRIPILTNLTLYRGQAGLFIETQVDNQAKDHKLSVVFPTEANPEFVHVDQPFMVMPRAVDLPVSSGWAEDPTPLMHQRAFTDISQDGRGLAVFNRGLPAVEINRSGNGLSMSITLLRCVGWLSRDDLWNRRVAAGPLVPTPGAVLAKAAQEVGPLLPLGDNYEPLCVSCHDPHIPGLIPNPRKARTYGWCETLLPFVRITGKHTSIPL